MLDFSTCLRTHSLVASGGLTLVVVIVVLLSVASSYVAFQMNFFDDDDQDDEEDFNVVFNDDNYDDVAGDVDTNKERPFLKENIENVNKK